MKHLSNDELVEGYRTTKNPEYFAEIFLRHSDSAFRTAFQFSGNNADAEDAVQIAFVKCMHDLHQYQIGTNLRTWLMRIVINTCKNNKIEEKRRSARHEKFSAQKIEYTNSENTQEKNELQKMVKKSVALLPEKYRTPIWLVLFEEFSYADASRSLELPEKTLRTQVARGLKKLKDLLKNSGVVLSVSQITDLAMSAPLQVASDSLKAKCADIAHSPNEKAVNIISKSTSYSKIISLFAIPLVLVGGFFIWHSQVNTQLNKPIVVDNVPTNISPKFKSIQKWSFDDNVDYSSIKPNHGKIHIVKNLGIDKSKCLVADEGSMFEIDISEFQLPIKITFSTDYIIPRGKNTDKSGTVVLKSNYPSNKNIFSFVGLRKQINLSDAEISKRSYNENVKNGYFGQWFERTIYVSENCIDEWRGGIRALLTLGTSTDNKRLYINSLSSALYDNIIIESIKPEAVPSHSDFDAIVKNFPLQKKTTIYELTNESQQLNVDKKSRLIIYEKKELENAIGLLPANDNKALTIGSN